VGKMGYMKVNMVFVMALEMQTVRIISGLHLLKIVTSGGLLYKWFLDFVLDCRSVGYMLFQ